MTERERQRPSAGRRAAVLGGTGAGISLGLGARLRAVPEALRVAIAAEAEAGRFAPWLAVAFGSGVLLYFTAPAEPLWQLAAGLAVSLAALAFLMRERPVPFALALLLAFLTAGFAVASVRAAMIHHSVLTRPLAAVTLSGFVESKDSTERSERIVLRVTKSDPKAKTAIPERVRLAFRKGAAPKVGEHIELRARLRPLLGPVRPGGYDFALGAYFNGLGATGFILGRHKTIATDREPPFWIRANAEVEKVRRGLTARIRASVPGDAGAVAAALVTGIRDDISRETNEALRVSGLYHVISISGLHMALIAGALFALARGTLALIPGLALRRPIKKWAAVLALLGVTAYLVLSGAEVATQRSYVMIAVVLVGVLFDRPALTLRTLAAAVVVTLIVSPEAGMNPGFQMSFAATLALVSFYERWSPAIAQPPAPGASLLRETAGRTGRWILLGATTSLVAGLATAVYAAFHFHRAAPYGVLANVLAMPLIAFVIMPMALAGILLLPFGFDAYAWQVMGLGIGGMIHVAKWVAAIDGADGRIGAFGAGAALLATVALLVLAIPATRLRLIGLPLALCALFLIWNAPRYDIYVDAEGDAIAVRAEDGKLSIHSLRRDRLATESWLAADGQGAIAASELARAFTCDAEGCTAKLKDGTLIALPLKPEALADDCTRAALIISRREVPANCPLPVIDRNTLAATGALALRKTRDGWEVRPARSPFADRPWYGRANPPDPSVLQRLAVQAQPKREASPPLVTPESGAGDNAAPEVPDESETADDQ
ncbi:MAG: ComEC family competence protein [Xanthobacteraceae bacterium]|nr:ComEC family competence protein [Xanthobacteraceae bacterium]QYK46447.1 MAG: ComEC family competence protein [Xanthobacteraceae bacterium]